MRVGVGTSHEAVGIKQILWNIIGASHTVDVAAKELLGCCQC